MIDDLTDSQRRLAEFMSSLSEKSWSAGWMEGLEVDLWRAVTSGPFKVGLHQIARDEIEQLRRLSADCGGWIVFDQEHEETFVPRDVWLAHYATLNA